MSRRERSRNVFFNLTSRDAFFKVTRRYIDYFGFERAALWNFIEEKAKRIAEKKISYRLKSVKNFGSKAEELIKNDYFYMSHQSVYDVIRIKKNAFTNHIVFFKENNLLEVERTGIPPRNYYKVNWDVAIKILTEDVYENQDDTDYEEDYEDEEEEFSQQNQYRLKFKPIKAEKSAYKDLKTGQLYNKNIIEKEYSEIMNKTIDSKESIMRGAQGSEKSSQNKSRISCSTKTSLSQSNTHAEKDNVVEQSSSLRDKFKSRNKETILDPLQADAEKLLNLWKYHGFCSKSKKKDIDLILDVMSGVFFGDVIKQNLFNLKDSNFGIADIEKSIENYSAYCTNHNQKKSDKTLTNFFYVPWAKNRDGGKGVSYFLVNLNGNRSVDPQLLEDENPETTMYLMSHYKNIVLGGANVNFSVSDENNFIKAAKFVVEFKSKYKYHLLQNFTGINSITKGLVICIFNAWNEDNEKMRPSLLNQKNNEILLIQHLQNNGVMNNKETAEWMKKQAGF